MSNEKVSVSDQLKELHKNGVYDKAHDIRNKKYEEKRLNDKNKICEHFGRHIDFKNIEDANNWLIKNNHIELLSLTSVREDITLGYYYILAPDHPLANKSGKVYYHRYQMSLKLGRYITKDEHVHHIDENKSNNDFSNLELINGSEHARLHALKRSPYDYERYKEKHICQQCNAEFTGYRDNNSKYCSPLCASNATKKFDPTKEELEKLVWEMPTIKVAQLFGVSDKAVDKRCKKLNIQKPPRGYWAKLQFNKL